MGLGRVAFEPVDEPGLGRSEREPVATGLLQRNEELPTPVHRLLVQFVRALELRFECKLAAHRTVRAPLAPDGDVRFGGDPPAKVQLTKVPEAPPRRSSHSPVRPCRCPTFSMPPTPGTRAPRFASMFDPLRALGSAETARCARIDFDSRPPDL